MGRALKPGEEVDWATPQGKTRGKVMRKLTHHTHVKGHKVAASADNPEYLVESEKSAKRAAHRKSALKRQ